ncbi:MAG: hypothetical protein AMJ53_04715, partial [Gammaproteobacteria bacterium SG8_11]
LLAGSQGLFTGATDLSVAELESVVDAALQRWLASGLVTADEIGQADGIEFHIVDLPGLLLGQNKGNVISIDADAAGHGWFVDKTPELDEEFIVIDISSQAALEAKAHTDAAGAMDLISVVSHELGHLFGFEHNDAEAAMGDTLDVGIRRLPPISRGEQEMDLAAQRELVEAFDYEVMDLVDVSWAQAGTPLIVNLPRTEDTEDFESDAITVVNESAIPINPADITDTTEFGEVLEELPMLVAETMEKNEVKSDGAIPEIKWEAPASVTDATTSKAQSDKSRGVGSWLKDFLGNLAGSKAVSPNEDLEVGLPEEAAPVKRKEEE